MQVPVAADDHAPADMPVLGAKPADGVGSTPSHTDCREEPGCPRSWPAAFLATVPVAPTIAAMLTIAALSPSHGDSVAGLPEGLAGAAANPLLGSTVSLLVAWSALAALYYVMGFTRADRANAGSFSGLLDRLRSLEAQGRAWGARSCSASACTCTDDPLGRGAHAEALAHTASVRRQLAHGGPRWILGSGYVYLWKRLGRAEEALIEIKPRPAAIASARYDVPRCGRAGLENGQILRARLEAAIDFLARLDSAPGIGYPASDEHRSDGAPPLPNGAWSGGGPRVGEQLGRLAPLESDGRGQHEDHPMPQDGSGRVEAAGPTCRIDLPTSEAEARVTLRQARRAINEFRTDRWTGLVRARNHLAITTGLVGVTAYVMLWLAIMHGGAGSIPAAAAFFLAGAIVGVFNQIHIDSRTTSVVDDYGLATGRLLARPLISGMAGLIGVVLVSVLSSLSSGDGTGLLIRDLFGQERQFVFQIIIAGTFGLTPGLVIDRLKQQTEQYKAELQASSPIPHSEAQVAR